MIINFSALATNPELYKIVTDGVGLGFLTGEQEIQPIQYAGLSSATRDQLVAWLKQQHAAATAADTVKARERAEEYVRIGLVDSQENADKISRYIKENGNYFSVASIDAAVHGLGRANLDWKEEPLEPLPNGEPRLPIESSEAVLRKASIAQLKDFRDRNGGIQHRRPLGSFSSSIF